MLLASNALLSLCHVFMISLLLVQNGSLAAEATPGSSLLGGQIRNLLGEWERDPQSNGSIVGMDIFDLSTRQHLFTINHEQNFVPASIMKLFTTAAALDRLGPSYQFKTELYVDGTLSSSGVLQGNVILKGYGDPSLDVEQLAEFARDLKRVGIRKINGTIMVDDSFFDGTRLGPAWMWDDEAYDFSAQISSLAVNENTVTVNIIPDRRIGERPTLTYTPPNRYVRLNNQLTITDGDEDQTEAERSVSGNTITLRGSIGKAAPPVEAGFTMNDPALFVGDVFQHVLAETGIVFATDVHVRKTVMDDATLLLATHYSRPLSELIVHANKESDNFYVEMFCKTLGALEKQQGSFAAGTEVVREFLQKAGVRDYRQADGSGLSRLNLFSPRDMIQLLRYVDRQPYRDHFYRSLPIAGVDGTLQHRMKDTAAAARLQAKTGSMSGVNSLAGIITAENGHRLIFCVMMNGVLDASAAQAFQDKLAVLLAKYPQLAMPQQKLATSQSYPASARFERILQQSKLNGTIAGVSIRRLGDNGDDSLLYERLGDKLLFPANNLQLLTVVAALQQLGPAYRFHTEVSLAAPPDPQGIVNGDLFIKGGGDPLIADQEPLLAGGLTLSQLVKNLQENGITQLNGNIIVDDSFFDDQRLPAGWRWDRESDARNAQISALSLQQGSVRLNITPAVQSGQPVQVQLSPKTNYVQVTNQAVTVERHQPKTLQVKRLRGTNTLVIQGKLPIGTALSQQLLTVDQPALYLGTVFKERLEQAGIKVSKQSKVLRGKAPATQNHVARYDSPPLAEVVRFCLNNDSAPCMEMLLKTLGATKHGAGGFEQSIEIVKETVRRMGISRPFEMKDGSGSSGYNLLSANQLTSLLGQSAEQLSDLLPRLDRRISAYRGMAEGTRTLSGYVTTKDGQRLCFSLFLNNATGDQQQLALIEKRLLRELAALDLTNLR
ncbi:D-alanyl-D-alanine carboxypeptidase/D-alanyl-D-alanine-endopeptidase [Brevibacillus fulvus]|uniref:PBP4 family serine-type D-alanyl-D-alanine carboxypeptidase n=1 Tax=Brevibacillus fulvus TaxID=1125967 RepID=A0A938XWE4_9BACL|nr:D-alanyl-D-alanine carboxypeptidase/D-alanyl-D-alanine-endopeptidase [Brevibacillus fulvus]MBM7588935.1 PBP4 family serine-type D-alanyl-D-alanine carboxypeptidase [Brevibacillus fulvus]